jgi:hypothetical protein
VNRVRLKGQTGITSEQFKNYPCFQKVKDHGKEFGRCVRKAQNFRQIASHFNNRAKDSSFSGRANKLMLDVLNEDLVNPNGERTVEKGMESPDAENFFIGFEGNKNRPLKTVLKKDWQWDDVNGQFCIKSFNPAEHIDWPENAQQIHLAIAHANWNYRDNKFTTCYSQEIILEKNENTTHLFLESKKPEVENLLLLFLFIGFSIKDRKKTKELKRSNNTVSILWVNNINQQLTTPQSCHPNKPLGTESP